MTRDVFYMAHPVSQDVNSGERGEQYFRKNVSNAKRWLKWLMENDRTRVYSAPWIIEVELAINNHLTTTYAEALADDREVVARFDGIILVGGAITLGMQEELDVAKALKKYIIDWSKFRSPWSPKSDAGIAASILLRSNSYGR
jgi:hypothetical protein